MDFHLDPASGVPIYVQLKQEIKYAIASGRYPPGSRLPTVRQLAVALRVNPNTVSRVYSELEKEGLLATRQGKGTFVKENLPADNPGREDILHKLVGNFWQECLALGFSPEEILATVVAKAREGEVASGEGNADEE